ncbi:polysaccharide biosynthesis C-terminal domain-containing protein [Salibacteraceae bacterium]|nr:polysaccharide biosynthesis C-terminal domain-containing protein [Salibacteraceae bacterium]MDB9708435.1 polysaccharide biosynthesis C-terminal domain-containing protein [Salibacteraceae bacterium]
MTLKKSIFYYFFSQFPVIVSGLLVSIISSRILGAEGKGIFGILTFNIVFIGLLLSFGFNQASIYFTANKKLSNSEVAGTSLFHFLSNITAVGLFLLTSLFFLPDSWFMPDMEDIIYGYIYTFIIFGLNRLNELIQSIFSGNKMFRTINQASILKGLLFIICYSVLYYLYLKNQIGLIEVLIGNTIVSVFTSVFWLTQYILKIGAVPANLKTTLSNLHLFTSFSKFIYISSLVNFLNYRVDVYFLEFNLSMKEVGIYLVAVNLSQMMWLVSDAFCRVLTPHLIGWKGEQKNKTFEAFQRLHTTIILVLTGIVWIIIDPLIPFLFGVEFEAAIIPTRILLLGNIFACSSKIFSLIPYSNNNVNLNLYATLFGLGVTLALDILLIPVFGIEGAAWASNFAYLTILVYLLFTVKKRFKVSIFNFLFVTRSDFKHIL